MAEDKQKGWGWPWDAKKAHYFVGTRSLCGKWAYTGPRREGNDTSSNNCALCKRRKKKRDN